MGVGHVPQDPLRPEGSGAHVQGRERRGAAEGRDLARVALGRWGEDHAARWYTSNGYVVIERNWRVGIGEIDLILRRGRELVFSEVKTRATDEYGDPSSAVTVAKQRRLRRLAAAWLQSHDVHGVDIRFDVVAVTGVRVRVIEDAF